MRKEKVYKGNSIQAIANFVWIRLLLADAASGGIKTASEGVNKKWAG